MRWPWQSSETRGYTDQITERLLAEAEGPPALVDETAALEAAAGYYGFGMAAATVEDASPFVARSITPMMLATVGRELVRRGESFWYIRMDDELVLEPCDYVDIQGGPVESDWRYRLQRTGPSKTYEIHLPGASVLHFRYAVDSRRPWQGLSPLDWAKLTGHLHAAAETYLDENAAKAHATLLPLANQTPAQQRETTTRVGYKRGSVHMVGHQGGAARPGQSASGWSPIDYGPNPPEQMVGLRSDTFLAVLAAAGIPPSLVQPNADGTAQRESFRRLLHARIAPLGLIVEAELRAKLDSPDLSLSFDSLFAADLSGRARAFGSMVQGGMDVAKAAALSGLMDADD